MRPDHWLEVAIARQGILQAVIRHHDERDAIGQRPVLVDARGIHGAPISTGIAPRNDRPSGSIRHDHALRLGEVGVAERNAHPAPGQESIRSHTLYAQLPAPINDEGNRATRLVRCEAYRIEARGGLIHTTQEDPPLPPQGCARAIQVLDVAAV